MIKCLRKRHLQAWIMLALLLPLGIVSAWLSIPRPVKDHLWQPLPPGEVLPVLLKKADKADYTVSLRSSTDGSSLQLEWINKSALTAPSAIIYQTSSASPETGTADTGIIGRIEGRGLYRFPLKKDSTGNSLHLILYDIIHHQLIDRINF